jgi:hypothetical protein
MSRTFLARYLRTKIGRILDQNSVLRVAFSGASAISIPIRKLRHFSTHCFRITIKYILTTVAVHVIILHESQSPTLAAQIEHRVQALAQCFLLSAE